MSNLQKLSKTIENLAIETQNLKKINEISKKVEKTFDEFLKTNEKIIEIKALLAANLNSQKENQKILLHFLERTEHTITESEKKFSKLIEQKSQQINSFLTKIDTNRKQYQKDLSENISENIENLSQNNNKFYKDLDDNLRIKLENQKSEIKQLIEIERAQVKQIMEIIMEIKVSTLQKELSKKIEEESQKVFDQQKKATKDIIIVLLIILFSFIIYKFM